MIALDLPGFGESAKPIGAPYDARWFARTVVAAMDAPGDRHGAPGGQQHGRPGGAGGRAAPPRPDRPAGAAVPRAGLAARPPVGRARAAAAARARAAAGGPAPGGGAGSCAACSRAPPTAGRPRAWTSSCAPTSLRAAGPPSTRPRATSTWTSRTARSGFWARLRALERDCLFVWGLHDGLVPVAFRRHVEDTLPRAKHLVLDCGHVPQVEAPHRTHQAMRKFLATA